MTTAADGGSIVQAWETSAKLGEPATPETIAHGTVKMEEHPQFSSLIESATSKGFTLVYDFQARVEFAHVVDDTGALLEVRRELHVIRGMRHLDLEHELGHIAQLERLGDAARPTHIYERVATGAERDATGNLARGIHSTKIDKITEYHNRLVEYVRLAERGAPKAVLDEHSFSLDIWRKDAEAAGLAFKSSARQWAMQHFGDIPSLEARCVTLGAALKVTKARW